MFHDLGLKPAQNLRMLDIGGGGGFFCKAFEDLGYGKSTYVDMDPQACEFASKTLHLKAVLNCDAVHLDKKISRRFDLIFSRHLIEHLPQPVVFLKKSLEYLEETGTFVVQCPNADSIEYLAYFRPLLKERVKSISKTNHYSKARVFLIMATGGMLHGIDPPRHLWAITGKGLERWAESEGVSCDINYYPLTDRTFSPYWKKRDNFIHKTQDLVAHRIFAPLKGGTHLVAIFRKT
ncbi:MAG: class I SAM-dependent methyltransferase [Candidatus Tantalella remota]|nr:class I SAM-dependent methyltransferase [Candidatus Tantalella remota]